MVYQPYAAQYTKKRNISQTRPSIKDDDDVTKKSKDLAVSKSLGNKEQVPSVMPTGNQQAPAVAARETIVNSAQAQVQKQGTSPNVGNIKAAPSFDMNMAMGSGGTAPSNQPRSEDDDERSWLDRMRDMMREAQRANEGRESRDEEQKAYADYMEEQRRSGSQGEEAERQQRYYDSDAYRNPLMGLGVGDARQNQNNQYDGGAGENEGADFGQALEDKLMEILGMDPAERARNEAGRALLAARSQAGRGQMGMSGAMLGLQADVMGEAALRAEDYLMDQQIDAARTGVRLEAMNRAEQLGLIDWVRSATQQGNSPEQIMEMLATLGVTGEEAAALLDSAVVEEADAMIGSTPANTAWAEIGWNPPPGSWWENGNNTGVDEGIVVPSVSDLPSDYDQTMILWTNNPRTFSIGSPASPHYRYEIEDSEGNKHYFYVPA